MKYLGSKNKHAKELLNIILKDRKQNQVYIEPFAGGMNVVDKVHGLRMANDKNKYLIDMWKKLVLGWTPNDFYSEKDYYLAKSDFDNKSNDNYENYEIGFIGHAVSYGGRFFEGYARGKNNKGIERNYGLETKNNILKQLPNLQTVMFTNYDYKELPKTVGFLYYCDAPYKNTKEYKTSLLGKFNYEEYYNWLKYTSKHNTVFISEYSMPCDFECIWEKKVNNTLVKDTGSKQGIEKLFIHRG